MGCKSSKISEKSLSLEIQKSIDSDNYKALASFLTTLIQLTENPEAIDSDLIFHTNLHFNPLGYALYKDKMQCFVCLLKVFKSNPLALINSYCCQDLNPITILCISGNIEIFSIFFPIYHEIQEASDYQCLFKDSLTPIQIATTHGHIGILNFLKNFFTHSPPPKPFDVNFVNADGDNCASIALKQGNYSVFRFIIEKCAGKIEGDDPIEICLEKRRTLGNKDYLECVMYLVNNLKFKVFEHHLESLTDSPFLSRFLESKLNRIDKEKKEVIESFSTNNSFY